MSPMETSNDTEESPRRLVVGLKNPRPKSLETDEANAFVENLHRAEDSRLEKNPPLGKDIGFARERDQWDILCLPKPENKIRTAHSLGDKGTTVFVNESGELVSFSKFLGLGSHGTVLVEPPVEYESSRVDEFSEILDGRLPGVGLRLKDRKQSKEQTIDFVHDRWPRVSYKIGNLEIKVQFMIHQGVIAHQYLIENSAQVPETCDFNLDLGFGARPSTVGLLSDDYQPPFTHSGISSTAGGYAAMLWAGDGRGQVQLDVVLFQDGKSVKLELSDHGPTSSESVGDGDGYQPEEVNELNARTSSPYHLHAVKIDAGVTRELTALYSLEKYSPTMEQEQTSQPKLETEEDESGRKQAAPDGGASESYSMRFGSQIDKQVPVTKIPDEIVSTGLDNRANNRSKVVDSAQDDWFWNYDGDETPDDTELRTDSEVFSKLGAEISNRHFLSPAPQYIDVSMLLKDNYRGNWTLKSTATNRLLRRHLQQLLFVNSVSIPRQDGSRSAIVLSEAHIISNMVPVSGSLSMFRFLLSMYAILDRPEVVEPRLREYLKRQIKDTCERHLDWVFDVSRPLQRGWAGMYNLNGSYSKLEEEICRWQWYYGAIQFFKLYEFRLVFQTLDDHLFVLQKLQKRLGPWLESLKNCRDPKSDMWINYVLDVNIVWLDPQYRQDESIPLPVYSVSDLICLWKALSVIFELLDVGNWTSSFLAKSDTPESTIPEMNHKTYLLKASLPSNWRKAFSPSKLRTKIMDHFNYEHVQDPREFGTNTKQAPAQDGVLDGDKDTIEDATREAGVYTKQAVAQEGEIHGDKDTIDESTKEVKDDSAKLVRDKTDLKLVRRKRVLAYQWAGNEKPRYLWYSWASMIFEAINYGFFKGESSLRVWKDTLEAQQVHRELSWEKPMRYAIALRAAQHGQSLDTTMDADQMRKRVRERLLKCFYSNGTFPTRLDLTTKQPTSKWWDYGSAQAVFEIPLLLLQEEYKCLDVAAFVADAGGRSRSNLIPPNTPTLRRGSTAVNMSADRNTQDTNYTEDDLDFDPEAVAKERAKLAKSAKHFARSTKVDRANVRDPPDFEPDWLFPYPDCFASDEPTGTDEETMLIRKQAKMAVEDLRQNLDYLEEPAYKVLEPGIEKYRSAESDKESFTFSASVRSRRARVFDVGKASRAIWYGATLDLCSLDELEIRLLRKRTSKSAKKRLTIIDSCQPEQALLLYLGSAKSEKLSTAGFLTRHKMREDFIRDHAHKEANLWITELHLSFYKKVTIPSDRSYSIPSHNESIFEDPEKLSAFPGEPKSSRNKTQKGAIGWRFCGDLHDRRWTGTILAFVPGSEEGADWISNRDLVIDKNLHGLRFHGQRQIIEARLFSEMTKTIHVSTREILRDLNIVLEEGEGGIYRGSSEDHDPFSESFEQSYSRSKLYLQLSDFLSHLDDSFKGIMETIEDYMNREKRRPVQPRWSIEDERQYRPELRKWDQEGKRNVALLRSLRSQVGTRMGRVQHLRESLNADMQLREARLQARSAEDVRLFTYVTIVFLPISFSSSLFSMQQAPGGSIVGTFAKVAVVALVITLIILFNLKTMGRNMWTYFNAGLHKTSYIMSISSWKFWKDTREDLVQAEKRNIHSDEPLQIRKTSKWWYSFFLLTFVLLELPATRVQMAYDVVFPPAEKDPKQLTPLEEVFRVILGLLFLPLFVFVYIGLFLLWNLIDLLFQLSSLPGVDKQRLNQGSRTSTDRSKNPKSLEINNIDDQNQNKGASDSRKAERAATTDDAARKKESARLANEKEAFRAYKEKYNARVARLTHPPRRYRPSAMASDRLKKGTKETEEDKSSEVEGGKDASASTKTRTARAWDSLGWKPSPKRIPQAAEEELV